MKTTTESKKTHAEQNAEGHAQSILALYRAFHVLDEGEQDQVMIDGYPVMSADEVRDRGQESALSVEVRGGWHTPGDEEASKAEEFNVLLSTGGPALRIIGNLDRYGQPDADSAKLQHQDWGTPWKDYRPDVAEAEDWDEAFAWFLSCFYFGE